jgi:murein DD-endopeptidase MepM/ murein hydrolase activator NlpD
MIKNQKARAFWIVFLIGFGAVGCTTPTKYVKRNDAPSKTATPATLKGASYPCKSPYTVVPGDTLSLIAYRCKVDMGQLAKINELEPPYLLYAKQELDLPLEPANSRLDTLARNQQAVVARTSNVSSPSVKPSQPNSSGAATAHTPTQARSEQASDSRDSSKWQWPVDKDIKSAFVRDNNGLSVLEVYGTMGTPVKAVAPGKVVFAGDGIVNFGWMVVLKHDDGYMSIYAHNQQLNVKEGDAVKTGQTIAVLGRSGNTKTTKLYLEARYQGRKVSINSLLKK